MQTTQMHPNIAFPYKANTARVISPPDKLPMLHSGTAISSPVQETGSYVFGVPPFDGSFIVKGRKTIYYYDKEGTLIPPASVMANAAYTDTFFISFFGAYKNGIKYYYGQFNGNILKVFSLECNLDTGVSVIKEVGSWDIPNNPITSLSSHIFAWNMGSKTDNRMMFNLLANTTVNGKPSKRVYEFKVGSTEVKDVLLSGVNGSHMYDINLMYMTSAHSVQSTIYASSVRRASESDSSGAVSVFYGGMYLDIIFPNFYGIPIPTLDPDTNPYQKIIPVTQDIMCISTSISGDGTVLGSSSPNQRIFSRTSWDEWLRHCCINGGTIYESEWHGKWRERA